MLDAAEHGKLLVPLVRDAWAQMTAAPAPRIHELRISADELLALKNLALVVGALVKTLEGKETKTETMAMLLTLMILIKRAGEG